MCLLNTISAKRPGAVRLAVEESGRPPRRPPSLSSSSRLNTDEPEPLSNSRQVGVRRTRCSHVVVAVCTGLPLCVELTHQRASASQRYSPRCVRVSAHRSHSHVIVSALTACSYNLQLKPVCLNSSLDPNEREREQIYQIKMRNAPIYEQNIGIRRCSLSAELLLAP